MARSLSEWQPEVNVGSIERGIRIVLGLALLALVVVGPRSLWGLVGMIPLFTGIVGYCPLYALADFSTVGKPHRGKHA